ncbi:DNA polymerase IV [Desulfolithobacter dissulfuricans]|uniref:DNA polymerase IV n=2 Tax=Desulfolithobacter dissulfuricans TaxID=2795293 RepID=A0A915U3C1_9BACT|nr:DNA polymerase IV [Desulfolithobacter dissulfuricans]
MLMQRTVLHLNIADFATAVERLCDSSLRHRPVIIGLPVARSLVYDMSDEAYREGVRKGMPLWRARRLCPGAVILPPRPERYGKAMLHLLKLARPLTPLVEQAPGDGHLYLDLSGTRRLHGPARDVALRLRRQVRGELGLEPIWTLAPNKLVAKVASRLVKPEGEFLVESGREQQLLAPLSLELLPGLGRRLRERLREYNLVRAGQVAALSPAELAVICPGRERFLFQAVRGIDHTPVQPRTRSRGVVRTSHLFTPDSNREDEVRCGLALLVEEVGYRLRQQGLGCCRMSLVLTYSDGISTRRQASFRTILSDNRSLFLQAELLLHRAWRRRLRIRSLALVCDRLRTPVHQLSLFGLVNQRQQRNHALSTALDTIHKRFGRAKLVRGSLLAK